MITTGSSFVLIDELELYRQYVYCCQKETSPREEFYQICTPFLMDSQLSNWMTNKDRKRKRKAVKQAPEFLLENSRYVQTVYEKFRISTIDEATNGHPNFSSRPSSSNEFPLQKKEIIKNCFYCSGNNKIARQCVKSAPLYRANRVYSEHIETVVLDEGSSSTIIGENARDHAIIYSNRTEHCILNGPTIVPPKSAVLLGDVMTVQHFPLNKLVAFDFIVMDPPWSNKTVKRQKTYQVFSNGTHSPNGPLEKLSQLPIPQLLANEALLCIWLSNSEMVNKSTQILLKKWKWHKIAQWHWLKICKSGDPVCAFRPEHKVPFESLLIACSDVKEMIEKFVNFPSNFCIISVPNANPSRKPPISLILQQLGFIPPVQNGLELYARYMLPNFTSVGDEATKFQHQYYFNSIH